VDVADYDRDQQLRFRENFVGVFLGIGERDGKPTLRFQRVSDKQVVQIPGVPADLAPTSRELKYTIRQTDEVVSQVDFVVQWVSSDEVPGSSSIGMTLPDPE